MRLTKREGGRRMNPSFLGVVEGANQVDERGRQDLQVGIPGCRSL